MLSIHSRGPFRIIRFALPLLGGLFLYDPPALCQDSAAEGTMSRGDRAEISVTIRNSSGGVLTSPVSVKLIKNGMPVDQTSTTRGSVYFIPRTFGDYSIVVEAAGYKTVQREISLTAAVKTDLDVILQRDVASNETGAVPGKPLIAPKAKEALEKGRQAIRENKLDEADKYLSEAARLVPANPEILYLQGILYLLQRNWAQAQSVLERSSQLDPNQPRVLSALGRALCNQKKYADAIPPLEKSLQLDPVGSWETEWALSKSYYYREQYEQALKMAQQAHETSKGTVPQVELLLAQCLTASGRFEDSAQVLRELIKQSGAGPDAAIAQRWLDGMIADGKIRREASPNP